MKLSRFNLWVEDYPQKGEHLLFNSRTQALLKLNQEFKEGLDRLKREPVNPVSPRINTNLDALRENGIIVDDEAEERTKLKDFFRQIKYESHKLPFEATILTTYSCNFRCVYCFEQSVREKLFMDKDTSDAVIRWLINLARERKLKKIYLVYYGGEPLLNIRPIYDISWQMQEWARKNNVQFSFGIITNGSLIYPELIDKLLSVGLEQVRISIDGSREAHNKNRPFADGSPTFDLIIDNIKGSLIRSPTRASGLFRKSRPAL